jgi:class 3 adenylate cyclase/thioesterase domain-containing protein
MSSQHGTEASFPNADAIGCEYTDQGMSLPVRFVTTTDAVRIAYAVEGDGPTYVFVRGWITHLELMGSVASFRVFMDCLATRLRVVRYDTRGNGLSDHYPPSLDLDALVSDLEAVVGASGASEVILHGSSYGGPIAIAYAARHPERVSRLVLDGTYARGDEIMSPERQAAFIDTMRRFPEAGFLFVGRATSTTSLDPDRVNKVRQSISSEVAAELYANSFKFDVTHLLSAVTMPALVLHRRNTRSIPLHLGRELAAGLPDARLVVLNGEAQNPWGEAPEVALRAIGEFLTVDLPLSRPFDQPVRPRSLTILLTDMESSTALTDQMGDAAAQELVRLHNASVRGALAGHHGREIKHTGDGILASFESASAAIACAVAIQERLAGSPVHVRIGVNAGEPIAEEDDLFGTAVQVTARVTDTATPGQILVSDVVRQLVAGRQFQFRAIGSRQLKGLSQPVSLYEVVWTADPPPASGL